MKPTRLSTNYYEVIPESNVKELRLLKLVEKYMNNSRHIGEVYSIQINKIYINILCLTIVSYSSLKKFIIHINN